MLGHCKGTEDAVRGRHNDALKLISDAIEAATRRNQRGRIELLVDKTVPTLPGPALRPDLQLYNHSKRAAAIVDLAITYEKHNDTAPSAMAIIADQKQNMPA